MSAKNEPQREAVRHGLQREPLSLHYRSIGISAVAAAAAQMTRQEREEQPSTRHRLPVWMRDEDNLTA